MYSTNEEHKRRYEEWRATVTEHMPWIADTVEACLSVSSLLWFKDVSLPFILILIGVPAGNKTVPLNAIYGDGADYLYKSDIFTEKAFVSNAMKRSKKQLADIDLLPRIQNKILITTELSVIFGQDKDKLMGVFGVLTKIADGQGMLTDTGAHGQRGYEGEYKFMWLGATTPMEYRVWEVMARLGTKMYFYHVKEPKWTQKERVLWVRDNKYAKVFPIVKKATSEFLEYLHSKNPIEWNNDSDPMELSFFIDNLSLMVARLRGKVNLAMHFDRETGKNRPNYTTPVVEEQTRAAIMLTALARGHAFVCGRDQISDEDMQVVIDVATSSAPKDRVEGFRILLRNGGEMVASDLVKATRCSRDSALRAMEVLSVLGIATLDKTEGYTTGYKAKIVKEMEWCLDDPRMKEWGVVKAKKPIRHRTQEELDFGEKIFAKHQGIDKSPR